MVVAWANDKSRPYTITGAPQITKGRVTIGNGGAELGVRGYVAAFSAQTGDMDWRFYTVPGNPEDGFENDTMKMAAKTWNGDCWEASGGGTVWDSMAYDPELNLLYIGVGNGSPWNHEIRSDGEGDNLFLSSIFALNPDTGDYVWHYQTTPAETWDYTRATREFRYVCHASKGNSLFSNNCLVCHGNSTMSAATIPNLRYSYPFSDPKLWYEIIAEGALAENGMPNFVGRINNEDREAIRA